MYVLNWSDLAANVETIITDWPTIRRGQKDTYSLLLRLFSFSFFQVACLRKTRSMGKKQNILTKSLFGVREKVWKIAQLYTFDKALVGRWFSQKLVLCENNAKRSGSTLPSCPLRRIYGAGWGNIKLGMSTIYKTHVNYFQQFKKIKSFDCTCGWWLCPRKDPLYWWQWFCVNFWKQKTKNMCSAVQKFAKKRRKNGAPAQKFATSESPVNEFANPAIH